MMRADDQYPSTFDAATMPQIMGGQDDLLAMLENARERIRTNWSRSNYFAEESDGSQPVCAIGAILAENFEGNVGAYVDALRHAPPVRDADRVLQRLDKVLSQTAKDAIAILDEVTLQEHPEAAELVSLGGGPPEPRWQASVWNSPLEWVNQDWCTFRMADEGRPKDDVKDEILRLYDIAIDRRREQLAA